MVEFNEFKKEVCDFYRKNKMTYFIWYTPEYYKCTIQVSFRKNNIEVLKWVPTSELDCWNSFLLMSKTDCRTDKTLILWHICQKRATRNW